MENHRLKYHPDIYVEARNKTPEPLAPPDGFHNVCISTSELERLRGLDRIYEVDGRIHLKDTN